MSEYPKMLYRAEESAQFAFPETSTMFATEIVADAEEEALFASDGWLTAAEALTSLNPLDRDGDGKAGGSKRKAKASEAPAEESPAE